MIKTEIKVIKNGDVRKGVESGTLKGLLESGVEIAGQATELAPFKTGVLRNSIMFITKTAEGGFNTEPGEKATPSQKIPEPEESNAVLVGSNTHYASHLEFGTVKMAAQPYLRPAIDSYKGLTGGEIMTRWGRIQMEKEFRRRKKEFTLTGAFSNGL